MKFTFAQTLLIGGSTKSLGETLKIRTKSGRALLSRSSTDIFVDICTVYGSNSMFFSTICRWVSKMNANFGSVTSAPKSVRSKSASCPMIVIF